MTNSRMLAKAVGAFLLGVWAIAAFAQTTVEVIPLRHRTAEEVIPILQPMLARDGSISGLRGQLVVRTTASNLAEIRKILASIDAPARQLMITVAQDVAADGRRSGAEVSGSVREGDVRFGVGPSAPRRGDGVQARIYDSRSAENVRVLQSLQVLEGRSAFIMAGQSAAVPQRRIVRSVVGGRVVEHVVEGTDYRDANTGFYVTPRLSGDRVTLDIAPQREVLTDRRGSMDVQRVVTSVSGRLGEWIEVAGVSEERTVESGVFLGRAGGTSAASRSVLLKVDEVR